MRVVIVTLGTIRVSIGFINTLLPYLVLEASCRCFTSRNARSSDAFTQGGGLFAVLITYRDGCSISLNSKLGWYSTVYTLPTHKTYITRENHHNLSRFQPYNHNSVYRCGFAYQVGHPRTRYQKSSVASVMSGSQP